MKMKVHILFAKDSGKTCITFLQVPLHTDSDSLYWEHLDSWSLTRTPKGYMLRNTGQRDNPCPQNLVILISDNEIADGEKVTEHEKAAGPGDCQVGDSTPVCCQYLAKGWIWTATKRWLIDCLRWWRPVLTFSF